MTILYLLIPLAVVLIAVAVAFFIWTVRTGQYEDMEGPAYRILMDDDDPMVPGRRKAADSDKKSSSDDASGAGDGS